MTSEVVVVMTLMHEPLHTLKEITFLNCGRIPEWAGILQVLLSMRYIKFYKSGYICIVVKLSKQWSREPHSLGPHLIPEE